MKLSKIDHIGIIVNDLSAAKAFFVDLGLEVQWESEMEGEMLEKTVGLDDVKTEVAMLSLPDGEVTIELIKFRSPPDEKGIQQTFSNTLGIRHVAFIVDDVDAIVARLKAKGGEIFGEVQNYDNTYKLVYCRGPEGIILELAEKVQSV